MLSVANSDKAGVEGAEPCSLASCPNTPSSEVVDELQNYVQRNPEGADLLICAIYAALSSYRRVSVCKPFPSHLFLTAQGDKDFKTPTALLETLPSTPSISTPSLSTPQQQLLHWLFLQKGKGRGFKSVPSRNLTPQLPHICSWPPDPNNPSLHPDLVLQLLDPSIPPLSPSDTPAAPYSDTLLHPSSHTPQATTSASTSTPHPSTADAPAPYPSGAPPPSPSPSPSPPPSLPSSEAPSRTTAPSFSKSLLAFHGTSLENLHSILQHGLLNLSGTSMQRSGSLFGDGIYLSTDYRTAYNFCHPGPAWPASRLGSRIRCVLLCEMDVGEGALGSKVLTGLEPNGASSRIPQTYWLVKSPDAVRVRYVLIFRDPVQRLAGGLTHHMRNLGTVNWALVLPLVYMLFMFLVGLKK